MLGAENPLTDNRGLWRRWQTWLWAVGLTLTMGFVSRLHRYLSNLALDEPFSFTVSFIRDLPIFVLINPLRVALVWMLADRFRFDRGQWRRNALLHVFFALFISYAHLMAQAVYYEVGVPALTHPGTLPHGVLMGVLPRFYVQLQALFQLDFLWYWAILGGYYAVHYYAESQERLLASARLQASLMQARVQALRSQLNPHFLFNTLNTISVLAMKGERHAVEETLANLGNLLRIALDDTRPDNITLREELEFIDGYLEIQRVRFSDRLMIHSEIDTGVLGALVPAMLLEPIVENAIKHGIAVCSGEQFVAIQASRVGTMLRLEVTDGGPGFPVGGIVRKGIGLANTEDRLQQLYGSRHKIEYGSAPGGGARVTITIPLSEAAATAYPAA